MTRTFALAALILTSALATEPSVAQSSPDSDKIREVVVYGTDPCPRSSSEEVVVCARRPETERYRIPEALRESPPSPDSESWASKAEALEYVGQTGIGSCSPVGPGGVTGCMTQLIKQAREERRAQAAAERKVP